jgi:hypothetical protein
MEVSSGLLRSPLEEIGIEPIAIDFHFCIETWRMIPEAGGQAIMPEHRVFLAIARASATMSLRTQTRVGSSEVFDFISATMSFAACAPSSNP